MCEVHTVIKKNSTWNQNYNATAVHTVYVPGPGTLSSGGFTNRASRTVIKFPFSVFMRGSYVPGPNHTVHIIHSLHCAQFRVQIIVKHVFDREDSLQTVESAFAKFWCTTAHNTDHFECIEVNSQQAHMKITNGKHNIKHSKQKNGFQLLNISTVGFTLGDLVCKGTTPPTI